MDLKVMTSIVSSLVLACLVYYFNESIFLGSEPYLFAAYLAVILIITTVDVFLIIRQKIHSKKLIMILVLIFSLLASMVMGRIDVQKRMSEGNHISQ